MVPSGYAQNWISALSPFQFRGSPCYRNRPPTSVMKAFLTNPYTQWNLLSTLGCLEIRPKEGKTRSLFFMSKCGRSFMIEESMAFAGSRQSCQRDLGEKTRNKILVSHSLAHVFECLTSHVQLHSTSFWGRDQFFILFYFFQHPMATNNPGWGW